MRVSDRLVEAPEASDDLADLPALHGLRVMLIGINYAPEPTGIAPYTTGMAEYLVGRGAGVQVITGVPHYPTWSTPARFRRRFETQESINGVEVLRLRHTVPRAMTTRRRAGYEASFLVHAALRTMTARPDVVIAVSPALGGAVAGALVARRVGCPLITVVQDLMANATAQSGISEAGSRAESVAARAEGFALRAADRVLVVSDAFRAGVETYGVPADRIALLRNWAHIAATSLSRDEARAALGWSRDAFLAVHTGNMGFKQDLGNVIAAGDQLGAHDGIEMVLVGNGSQREELVARAEGSRYVRFVDSVDDQAYPLVLAAADVLLVNERASVAEMSLPSKLTSYFAAGRPVVAAVAAGGATCRELQMTRAAVTVPAGDPAALVGAVRSLRDDRARRDDLAASGRRYCERRLSAASSLARLHVELVGLERRSA